MGVQLTGGEIQVLPWEDNHVYLSIVLLCEHLDAGYTVEKGSSTTSLDEHLVRVHKKTWFREDIGVQIFVFGAAHNGTLDGIKYFLPSGLRHLPQALGVVNPEADFQLLLWAFKANTSFSLTVKKKCENQTKTCKNEWREWCEDTYVKIISNLFYLSMSGDASIFCEIAEGLVDQRFNFVPGQYTQHTREGEYRWRKVKEFSLYNKCLWNTKTKHLRV